MIVAMVSPYRGDYVSQEHEDGGGYTGHAGIDLAGPSVAALQSYYHLVRST